MNETLRNRLSYLNKLDGWCWQEKSERLADLVISEGPDLIVELGVFGGRSIGALAMAVQHTGRGRCIGIDPWSKPAALEGDIGGEAHVKWWDSLDLERVYANCQGRLKQLGLDNTIELWRMKDTDAIGKFQDGTIDLIHSDSNHSKIVSERVTREWHPKLKDGGILVFDDCAWETQAGAVVIIKGELGYEILHEETGEKGSYLIARKRKL